MVFEQVKVTPAHPPHLQSQPAYKFAEHRHLSFVLDLPQLSECDVLLETVLIGHVLSVVFFELSFGRSGSVGAFRLQGVEKGCVPEAEWPPNRLLSQYVIKILFLGSRLMWTLGMAFGEERETHVHQCLGRCEVIWFGALKQYNRKVLGQTVERRLFDLFVVDPLSMIMISNYGPAREPMAVELPVHWCIWRTTAARTQSDLFRQTLTSLPMWWHYCDQSHPNYNRVFTSSHNNLPFGENFIHKVLHEQFGVPVLLVNLSVTTRAGHRWLFRLARITSLKVVVFGIRWL